MAKILAYRREEEEEAECLCGRERYMLMLCLLLPCSVVFLYPRNSNYSQMLSITFVPRGTDHLQVQ